MTRRIDCFLLNPPYLFNMDVETKTFAKEVIQKRIIEKQRQLKFQDFGYGDENSEAPYDDYLDYLDGETYPEAAN